MITANCDHSSFNLFLKTLNFFVKEMRANIDLRITEFFWLFFIIIASHFAYVIVSRAIAE